MAKLKTMSVGKISVEQIMTFDRAARRQDDIENNMNFNRHRVHKNAKAYNRNKKHKGSEF